MDTKEKIVAAAVKLFNEKGISDVAIRDISDAISISSGNFAYHFKNKEAILGHFYATMYDEVVIDTNFSGNDGFEKFEEILRGITGFMTKYSFFYTDIVEIFRLCPVIKKDYTGKYEGRKTIYKGIFNHFISKGLLREEVEHRYLDNIAHIVWFTMTFWQSQKKILPKGCPQVQPDFVIEQVWHLLLPYMTSKGLKKYSLIKQK